MDYKPRYPQPFTLTEAISLDVSVITEGWHFIAFGSVLVTIMLCSTARDLSLAKLS
jgi:hypothetical protein